MPGAAKHCPGSPRFRGYRFVFRFSILSALKHDISCKALLFMMACMKRFKIIRRVFWLLDGLPSDCVFDRQYQAAASGDGSTISLLNPTNDLKIR
jgi:hypothetical protein